MSKEKWTTDNMPDLSGKIIIVTGGNSGLGYESVKAFAQKGAEVILASRSVENGEKARSEIEKTGISGKIYVMQLDLMELASIRRFASTYKEKYKRLDVLLNNAGIMTTPYFLTKDGFEAQMGTNHLGHFALTSHLLDLIKKTPGSRVVNVSSNAHKWGKMDFDNFLFEDGKGYSPMKSYSRSKLANLLFTYELQEQFENHHVDSIAIAAHPGSSQTNLVRFIDGKMIFKIFKPLLMLMTQNQEQGALPQIRASVDPNVKGAEYYGPNGFGEMKGLPVLVKSNTASHKREDAKKLWKISEKLTNVSFTL
jgi:NAD(P)-dependent dehydrogenase (short-subunit alcohol dehydrogenase family)